MHQHQIFDRVAFGDDQNVRSPLILNMMFAIMLKQSRWKDSVPVMSFILLRPNTTPWHLLRYNFVFTVLHNSAAPNLTVSGCWNRSGR